MSLGEGFKQAVAGIDGDFSLILPPEFLPTWPETEKISRKVVVVPWGRGLGVFPKETWLKLSQKFELRDSNAVHLARYLAGSSVEVPVGVDGKIVIPLSLRDLLVPGGEVTLILLDKVVREVLPKESA